MPVTNIFSPELKRKFNRLDIDIVHSHHPFWLGSRGMTLAEQSNIPTVYTYHTRLEKYAHYLPSLFIAEEIFRKRIAHMIVKRFSNRCNAAFAPTASAKEYLRNIGVSKYIEVLPTGIELDKYIMDRDCLDALHDKIKTDCEILLFSVSRLSKEKNLYFLLKGLKYIKQHTEINFKCLIAGDGSEKENIQNHIIENGLENYVKLIGLIDNEEIHKYYILSDLFVFASKSETQGMVLLEAMAGQTPVIAVRSSGIDDVIENGVNGYKTREDVSEWSQKVIKLMQDQVLLEKMSENAYEVARDHSIASMAKKAEKVYNKIVSYQGKGNNEE
jgi:glycosyltransferase involved in cell wall biosynthesis